MSRTEDPTQYIEQQTAAHAADLTQAVIAGDAETLQLVGEALSELSDTGFNELLIRSFAGINALGEFINATIEAEAARRAEADADRVVPATRRSSTIARRAEELAWDRLQAGHLEFS